MQLPKLTPLQSRLLASAIATCLVVVLWVLFQPQHFVYAAEIPIPPEYKQSEIEASAPPSMPHVPSIGADAGIGQEKSDNVYAPEFAYFDRALIGRQQDEVDDLNTDQKAEVDATPGTTRYFRFKKSQLGGSKIRTVVASSLNARDAENGSESDAARVESLSGEEVGNNEFDNPRKRQAGSQLWISANTCRQPTPTVNLITESIPQLTLYVSTSTKNTKPGPSATNDATTIPFEGGYANFSLQTDQDVYIAISAPSLSQGWNGSWHFELAASVKGYYHSYDNNTQFMYMVDTDSESALFITDNLTTSNSSSEIDKWKNMQLPFTMYTFPNGTWSPMMGLERSYCGLKEQFNTTNNITVDTSITTKFGQDLPKGQFHVQGLQTGKAYTGFLAVTGNTTDLQLPDGGTVRAGGQVFQSFSWITKADDSCQVIFGLDFCADVAYAVPSSQLFKQNDTGLKTIYDDQAKAYYQNFSNSLDQVACDTTSTAQYSLARTCDDCRKDYKAWLCSVLIPRCEDWSATGEGIIERNINARFSNGSMPYSTNTTLEFNQTRRERFAYSKSRNPMIDLEIKPGPYKELLPCEDLCFDIVRSCPAQLSFACPNSPARELSYGKRDPTTQNLTCNFPGAVVNLNQDRGASGALTARMSTSILVALLVAVWSWI